MSKKHGRRIYDTVRGEDLREKTRSALYDIIADLIQRSPGAAEGVGYRLLTKELSSRLDSAAARIAAAVARP